MMVTDQIAALRALGTDPVRKLVVPRVVAGTLMVPVLTGLMVAGRVGSGIAAELGSMMVTDQIAALRALGTDPVRKLVVPRVLAGVFMMPMLSVLATGIGMLALIPAALAVPALVALGLVAGLCWALIAWDVLHYREHRSEVRRVRP